MSSEWKIQNREIRTPNSILDGSELMSGFYNQRDFLRLLLFDLCQKAGDRLGHQLKEERAGLNRMERFFQVHRHRQGNLCLLLSSQSEENIRHLLQSPLIEKPPLPREEFRQCLFKD